MLQHVFIMHQVLIIPIASLDKQSPNMTVPIKKKTMSSSIKNFSLYIGSK